MVQQHNVRQFEIWFPFGLANYLNLSLSLKKNTLALNLLNTLFSIVENNLKKIPKFFFKRNNSFFVNYYYKSRVICLVVLQSIFKLLYEVFIKSQNETLNWLTSRSNVFRVCYSSIWLVVDFISYGIYEMYKICFLDDNFYKYVIKICMFLTWICDKII